MSARDRLTPAAARALDNLTAMDGLHVAERLGGPAGPIDPQSTVFVVPPSLRPIRCDDCGTSTPAEVEPDAVDLLHEPECHVAVLEERQRTSDTVFLLALRAVGLPAIRVRPVTEVEVALHDSAGIDVRQRQCRVELLPSGARRRTWPAPRQA